MRTRLRDDTAPDGRRSDDGRDRGRAAARLGTDARLERGQNGRRAFGVDFETFVSQATETFQDLGALYAGIEDLRYLDGEKHLVLFTESGLRLWRREDNINLANAASDARIALDTIHTGGIAGAPPPRFDVNGTLIDAADAEHRGGGSTRASRYRTCAPSPN